jgi:hypothetical protein
MGGNIGRISCVLFCGEHLALLPPGHTDVRGENIDRISFGERLAFLPPGDINVRGENTGQIFDERSGLLPSETKAPDLAPATATAAGPAVVSTLRGRVRGRRLSVLAWNTGVPRQNRQEPNRHPRK